MINLEPLEILSEDERVIKYEWAKIRALMLTSVHKRGIFCPVMAKVINDIRTGGSTGLSEYCVGAQLTEEFIPIQSGVPGNTFCTVTEIDTDAETITVRINPSSTMSPANPIAIILGIDAVSIADLPVGTPLVENPITHKYEVCRTEVDPVDATVMESIKLPFVQGWTLEQYIAYYGEGVYEYDDDFWTPVGCVGSGVHQVVWYGSGNAKAGEYISPLGHTIQNISITRMGRLLNSIVLSSNETTYSYRTIHGEIKSSTTPIKQVFADFGGEDTNTNTLQILPSNGVAAGSCFTLDSDGVPQAVTRYDQKIAGIAIWSGTKGTTSYIAGQTSGKYTFLDIESRMHIGDRIAYNGAPIDSRIALGTPTATLGRVVDVITSSPRTAIIEVDPQMYQPDRPFHTETAENTSVDSISSLSPVTLGYNLDDEQWEIRRASPAGGSGISLTSAGKGGTALVQTGGKVTITWSEMATVISNYAKTSGCFSPLIAVAIAAKNNVAYQNYALTEYYPGISVTYSLLPISEGFEGNRLGIVTAVTRGTNPSITIEVNPLVSTSEHVECKQIQLLYGPDDDDLFDTWPLLPVGSFLTEEPNGKFWPCVGNMSNVDATALTAVKLPSGSTLADLDDYQAVYGPGAYKYDNVYWMPVAQFGEGVHRVAWRDIASSTVTSLIPELSPESGRYLSPLGNTLNSYTIPKVARLTETVKLHDPPFYYRTVHGAMISQQDAIVETTAYFGSYSDRHPNVCSVYNVVSPTTFSDGDMFYMATTGGPAKVTDATEKIIGVVERFDSSGGKMTGRTKGLLFFNKPSDASLNVGDRIMFNKTSAETRISQGQKTCVLGRIVEAWYRIIAGSYICTIDPYMVYPAASSANSDNPDRDVAMENDAEKDEDDKLLDFHAQLWEN